MKEIMIRGMSKVMLDCEHATMLAVKSETERIPCLKKLQLQMHLMGCKLCRAFAEQSRTITEQIDRMKSIDPDNPLIYLSDQQKEHLKQVIEEKRNSKR